MLDTEATAVIEFFPNTAHRQAGNRDKDTGPLRNSMDRHWGDEEGCGRCLSGQLPNPESKFWRGVGGGDGE